MLRIRRRVRNSEQTVNSEARHGLQLKNFSAVRIVKHALEQVIKLGDYGL